MLLALAMLIVSCQQDPAPVRAACGGGDAPAPAVVSETRLMADVAALAADSMQGRAVGSEGGLKARRYLAARIRGLRLDTLDALERPFAAPTQGDSTRRGANLVAYVPGTRARGPWLLVTAHYDHVGMRGSEVYNGADDNASGTAAVLAMAEHFRAHPPAHPIMLVWLDGEERGLVGSAAFVSSPPVPLADVAVDVNLDMVG
ncbi:MAG TPA: M28 family peptidase, partial [Gemmatimonadales bacterium]|nr:M28 family peptidase [Gemmatimonadales bacterium]